MNDSGQWIRYGGTIARYFLRLIAWLWLLHFTTWALFDLLPSPEFGIAGWAGIDPAVLAATREKLGLHGSFLERYWTSLINLLHGDLGHSLLGGYPVAGVFAQRLLNSFPQWLASLLLLLAAPVPMAMLFCSRKIGLPR